MGTREQGVTRTAGTADPDPARPDIEDLARLFGVLANPMRLRIVGMVATCELSGNEVAEGLGISRALACHHLNKLADCGLVRRRREGQMRFSILDRGLLDRQLGAIARLAALGAEQRS